MRAGRTVPGGLDLILKGLCLGELEKGPGDVVANNFVGEHPETWVPFTGFVCGESEGRTRGGAMTRLKIL